MSVRVIFLAVCAITGIFVSGCGINHDPQERFMFTEDTAKQPLNMMMVSAVLANDRDSEPGMSCEPYSEKIRVCTVP